MARSVVRRWTSVDGQPVHSRETASAARHAAPLVFVHGLAVSSRYAVPLLQAGDDEGVPIVAPDLPGLGHTPRRAGAVVAGGTASVAGQARFVARWLDRRGVAGPVVVLGNSLGAQVAVELAVLAPDLVAALVLVGPTVDPAARSAGAQLRALVADVPRERPSLVAQVAGELLRTDPRLVRDRARGALGHDVAERLAGVAVPVVVVRGRDDPLVSPGWARRVALAAPSGEVVELAGGHAVHHHDPRAVLAIARSVA